MTTPDTLPGERQQTILRLLREQGRVFSAQLALQMEVSEDSIRRDLRELANQGLCRKVHGGALPAAVEFPPLPARHAQQPAQKHALALAAAACIRPGERILLDAGSTNSAIAACLPQQQGLHVITNAPDIALALLARGGIEVTLIGGRLDPRAGACIGAQALETVAGLRADVCFIGTCAVDAEAGLWAIDGEEAPLKRAVLAASSRCVAVATNDKLGTQAAYRVGGVEQIDLLVIEHDAPDAQVAAFARRGVDIQRAAPY
ncbi:DeoR/GlpR family DNA-binding transcription regulator [Stenotrophomonas rhizophila]|uniref:DeoR/GlpR family DNA-binding transcription regulator n=1 Tax=Stenotrophomonas rhizophila TaxID=216778 RepID=UPI00081CB2F7|nr:DeoR/GlpR family DNA-binding transcription regulator [Stenotrophomonas rhizophila]AOA72576.1 DeoR family transcriptional regulator [Stenotrophomonas rhizophila]